jgi:hypothetical protein
MQNSEKMIGVWDWACLRRVTLGYQRIEGFLHCFLQGVDCVDFVVKDCDCYSALHDDAYLRERLRCVYSLADWIESDSESFPKNKYGYDCKRANDVAIILLVADGRGSNTL